MDKAKKENYIILSVIGLILIIGTIYNSVNRDYLKNGKATLGIITDYGFCNNNWCGDYSYEVDGKKYNGSWVGGFFKCNDGTKGCVGKKFTVIYSPEKPEISEINLKKYNHHKHFKPRFW